MLWSSRSAGARSAHGRPLGPQRPAARRARRHSAAEQRGDLLSALDQQLGELGHGALEQTRARARIRASGRARSAGRTARASLVVRRARQGSVAAVSCPPRPRPAPERRRHGGRLPSRGRPRATVVRPHAQRAARRGSVPQTSRRRVSHAGGGATRNPPTDHSAVIGDLRPPCSSPAPLGKRALADVTLPLRNPSILQSRVARSSRRRRSMRHAQAACEKRPRGRTRARSRRPFSAPSGP